MAVPHEADLVRLVLEATTHTSTTIRVSFAALILVVFAGVALLALGRRRRPVANVVVGLGILAASVVWLRASQSIEGPTLKQLSYNHGVTVGDLVVIPCVAVAVGLWVAALVEIRSRHSPDVAGSATQRVPMSANPTDS